MPAKVLLHVPLKPADLTAIKSFLESQPDRFRAPLCPPLCDRDGHSRVARWRGNALRAWRCQRCGREEQS